MVAPELFHTAITSTHWKLVYLTEAVSKYGGVYLPHTYSVSIPLEGKFNFCG
jgi:hypothetical protein